MLIIPDGVNGLAGHCFGKRHHRSDKSINHAVGKVLNADTHEQNSKGKELRPHNSIMRNQVIYLQEHSQAYERYLTAQY